MANLSSQFTVLILLLLFNIGLAFPGYSNPEAIRDAARESDALTNLPIKFGNIEISEFQFWIYQSVDQNLVFNSPWDETPGDDIKRDREGIPSYVDSCLVRTLEVIETTMTQEKISLLFEHLQKQGATTQLIILVNGIDQDSLQSKLRWLDRDVYFWHWTPRDGQKPVISLSDFSQAKAESKWVWEVIATPLRCIQPNRNELIRYLEYASALLEPQEY
ncbi:MAG: hypothetical protein ACOH5I_08925 [Oligoflexus sp.]